MSNWKECTLGNIANIIPGYAFKSKHMSKVTGVPVVKIGEIEPPYVNLDQCEKVDISHYKKLDNYWLARGDIVVAMTGATIGKIGRISVDQSALLNQRVAKIAVKSSLVDSKFLYYLILQNRFQDFIINIASGSSVQENISAEDIGQFEVKLPPFPEQRAIASVLSSLDNKIDLLHRQNKTLETLAETLFRQWFVEEAKESWTLTNIGEVVTIKGGTTPSTTNPEFWDGLVYWSTPKDLSKAKIFLTDTDRKITEKGLAQIGSGLLPVGTVLLSSRAPIGYLTITDISVAINQGYIAVICDKELSNFYMYLWIKNNLDVIVNAANGSTFLEISKSTFKGLELRIPPAHKLSQFNTFTESTFEKIRVNIYQIRTLESLRDTLLPKLMSGEVRVQYNAQEETEQKNKAVHKQQELPFGEAIAAT